MAKTVGIDLGTTNSVVALLEAGTPTVIPNSEGARTTPSVVAFTSAGEALVGELAKRQSITNPERTVRSVKRKMGTTWTVSIEDKDYTPQEISARVLAKLKHDAEEFLGDTVERCVVTVPAYFDDAQRTATKEAAQIAGLEVLRIINEPTAAALAYGLAKQSASEETVLVFDLGGGTFDASLLTISDGVFEVRATAGNTQLGGDDWDQRIAQWAIEEFRTATGVDLAEDKLAAQRLKEAAEKAKIELSTLKETQINLPFIGANDEGPLHLDLLLTRATFERLTKDLLDACEEPFIQVMSDAGVDAAGIDHVILVGGSTRMPAVVELVKRLAGKDPHRGVNPDEVVAVGAAVQAGVLEGNVSDVLLLDVTPLSLGLETQGGVMHRLIERNTTIPTRRAEVYTTAADNQPSVEIHVLQGEREMASGNRTLGRFGLGPLPPAPRGVPQIEVTFDIDTNGIVHVSARDLATGKEQMMTISGQSALSPDEIANMVAEAKRHESDDRRRREAVEARNAAEGLVHQVRQVLTTSAAPSTATRVTLERSLAEMDAALAANDPARIKAATAALEGASHIFAEELYSRPVTMEQPVSVPDASAPAAPPPTPAAPPPTPAGPPPPAVAEDPPAPSPPVSPWGTPGPPPPQSRPAPVPSSPAAPPPVDPLTGADSQ